MEETTYPDVEETMSRDQRYRTIMMLAPQDGPYPDEQLLSVARRLRCEEAAKHGVAKEFFHWPPTCWKGWAGDRTIDLETSQDIIAWYRSAMGELYREARDQRQRADALQQQLEQRGHSS